MKIRVCAIKNAKITNITVLLRINAWMNVRGAIHIMRKVVLASINARKNKTAVRKAVSVLGLVMRVRCGTARPVGVLTLRSS